MESFNNFCSSSKVLTIFESSAIYSVYLSGILLDKFELFSYSYSLGNEGYSYLGAEESRPMMLSHSCSSFWGWNWDFAIETSLFCGGEWTTFALVCKGSDYETLLGIKPKSSLILLSSRSSSRRLLSFSASFCLCFSSICCFKIIYISRCYVSFLLIRYCFSSR